MITNHIRRNRKPTGSILRVKLELIEEIIFEGDWSHLPPSWSEVGMPLVNRPFRLWWRGAMCRFVERRLWRQGKETIFNAYKRYQWLIR